MGSISSQNARVVVESGKPCAYGIPLSPDVTTWGSNGMRPRNEAPISSASCFPPPMLKMSTCLPQCGQINPLIFSNTPITGILSLRQNVIDLRTSLMATCCGVVTIIAPSAPSIDCATVKGSSSVPGGESYDISSDHERSPHPLDSLKESRWTSP